MAEFFYDGQIRRYFIQFQRALSNFYWEDGYGNRKQIPVTYGDINFQVAQAMKKNTENTVPTVPYISCYIKSVAVARERTQNPTHVSVMNIRERLFDTNNNEYVNQQGKNYTVERLMPTPFNTVMVADIWASNFQQKLQIFEQIAQLFNPALELQSNASYFDWTSISYIELTDINFSSRQIPQGQDSNIDILSMSFKVPIWLSEPAKVKRLNVVTQIINSVFCEPIGDIVGPNTYKVDAFNSIFTENEPVFVDVTTFGDFSLLVLDNTVKLMNSREVRPDPGVEVPEKLMPNISWNKILDAYPGIFRAGLSQVRLTKPNGMEIIGYMTMSTIDDSIMTVTYDTNTIPADTMIYDLNNQNPRGTIDSIVNPQTFDPRIKLITGTIVYPSADTRYLILESIVQGAAAWFNLNGSQVVADANDIIQWDGSQWNVLFNSTSTSTTYVTNNRTGIQYMWNGDSWSKSFEGIYSPQNWRLCL